MLIELSVGLIIISGLVSRVFESFSFYSYVKRIFRTKGKCAHVCVLDSHSKVWGQNKRKQIQQKKEARATAKEQHAKKKTKNVKIALNHLQTLWAKIGCFLFFSEKKKMLTSLQLTKTELRVWKWEYGMVTEGQAGVKGNAVFAKRASFLILQKCYVAFNTLRHCNT